MTAERAATAAIVGTTAHAQNARVRLDPGNQRRDRRAPLPRPLRPQCPRLLRQERRRASRMKGSED